MTNDDAPARLGGPVRIKDVAELAGVSLATVSNVVTGNRKVTPAFERRVRDAVEALGYVPNDSARALRTGSTGTIGLVLADLTNPFFVSLALGAEQAAAEAGLSLLIGTSPEGSDREARYITVFQRQRVDGMLVTPPGASRTLVNRIRGIGAKIVMVERKDPANGHCSINVNDRVGGLAVGRHLIQTGRRDLWFVGAPVVMSQMEDRLAGFASAVAEGRGKARLTEIAADDLTIARGLDTGRRIAALPEAERPDAVFAGNDLVALGLLQAFHEERIDVPGRIAVVGCDDIPFASTTSPQLTTVRSPSFDVGYEAVRMLVQEIAEGDRHEHRHVTLEPELVVRESA